ANDVVLAPQRAVVRPPDDPNGQAGVYTRDGNVARFMAVQVGADQGDEVEVRGVPAGAEVIVEGQHGLQSGTPVILATAAGGVAGRSAPKGPAPAGAPVAAEPARSGGAPRRAPSEARPPANRPGTGATPARTGS